MLGARPVLVLATIGAVVVVALCLLVGGGALVEGAKTAIAVSR